MMRHPERIRAPPRVPDHVRRPCHAMHVRQARFVSGLRGRRRGRTDRQDWVTARIGVDREDRARHCAGSAKARGQTRRLGSGAQEDEEHYGHHDQHRPKHQPRHDPEVALHLLVRRHQFVQAGINHIQVAV